MKRASLANAAVPEELLSEWAAADGTLPAAFLLHPDVRGDGTEGDVRGTLEKKELGLEKRVSTKDFVKLADPGNPAFLATAGLSAPPRFYDIMAAHTAEI